MDVDDDSGSHFGGGSPFGGIPLSSFGGFGGMPGMGGPGMNGSSRRRTSSMSGAQSSGNEEIVRPLKVTLEELYWGTTKKLKIGRKLLSGAQDEK